MLCSTLKKKLLEASDCNFGELFESFQQLYDLLWFNSFLGFPIIPFDQELEVINPNNSQHTFSDNSLDTTPSSVSHRICRKRSDVTLVLDLDGNFPSSFCNILGFLTCYNFCFVSI